MDISVLRNLVIRYGARLNLKPNEQVCLWHLLDHDFTGKGYVFPSESRIANLMGLKSSRQVKRLIHELEEKKYISVRRTKGFSNRYNFKGIVKVVLPYLKDELKKEHQRFEKSTGNKNVPGEHNNLGQKCPQVVTKMSPGWGQKCPPKHCNRNTANNHSNTAPQSGAAFSSEFSDGPEKQPSEWQILFGTLAEVCCLDIKISRNAARVGRELRELMKATVRPTRELLLERYGENKNGRIGWNWYKHDWRGKDKAPTLSQVTETWGNWKIIETTNRSEPQDRVGEIMLSAMRGAEIADNMVNNA